MPKCTIDGREIEVPAGTNVLQAALAHGIHIQHFCWHPDLPVDGNCRTCMIEVEKMPKLQIACNTVISEGMIVHTKSPKALEAQRTALEKERLEGELELARQIQLELLPAEPPVLHGFQIAGFLPEASLAVRHIQRFVRMRAGWGDD